jgi:hypothetical protein
LVGDVGAARQPTVIALVDAVNTFRVVSRTFASSDTTFPQVSTIFAPGSIPGSSTKRDAGQDHKS